MNCKKSRTATLSAGLLIIAALWAIGKYEMVDMDAAASPTNPVAGFEVSHQPGAH